MRCLLGSRFEWGSPPDRSESRNSRRLDVHVFQAALYEVGQRWELSELSVAQEHFVTAATQHIMAVVSGQIFQTAKSGLRLLSTSIGGNFHSVGIRSDSPRTVSPGGGSPAGRDQKIPTSSNRPSA
jgi:B12 binding domain